MKEEKGGIFVFQLLVVALIAGIITDMHHRQWSLTEEDYHLRGENVVETSIETQDLVDRLARMDPADPHHDRPAIEQAITEHLRALGLPARPCIWADGVRTGYWVVAGYALAAAEAALREAAEEDAMDVALDAARKAARDPAWEEAKMTVSATGPSAIVNLLSGTAWDAVQEACGMIVRAVWTAPAGRIGSDIAWESAWEGASEGALSAVMTGVTALGQINAIGRAEDAASDKLIETMLPMVKALEAGLFLYWVTSRAIVCVPRPLLAMENGRLHRMDGPALGSPLGSRRR